jgi:hypothetical protein
MADLQGKVADMLLAVLALIAFVIAAVLELVKVHIDWVIWLVIIGGILICAHAIWGWWGARSRPPTR